MLLSVAAGSVALTACGRPATFVDQADSGEPPAEALGAVTTLRPVVTVPLPPSSLSPTTTVLVPPTTVPVDISNESAVPSLAAGDDAAESFAGEPLGDSAPTRAITLKAPVDRIIFVGDSIQSDLREIGGRPNNIVPALALNLALTPGLEHVAVDNEAVPGLAIKFSTAPLAHAPFHTVGGLVQHLFSDGSGTSSDLVVLAASAIDIGTEFETPIEELAPILVAELEHIVESIEAVGVQVVVLPTLGVNDELYGALKLMVSTLDGGEADLTTYDMGARTRFFNQALVDSSLPLLFADFDRLDHDGDGLVDINFFENYDLGGWPDDGVHPNKSGETAYVLQVLPPLVDALLAAQVR